jgi:hypothetical protein
LISQIDVQEEKYARWVDYAMVEDAQLDADKQEFDGKRYKAMKRSDAGSPAQVFTSTFDKQVHAIVRSLDTQLITGEDKHRRKAYAWEINFHLPSLLPVETDVTALTLPSTIDDRSFSQTLGPSTTFSLSGSLSNTSGPIILPLPVLHPDSVLNGFVDPR